MMGLPLLLVVLSGVVVDDAVTSSRLEQMLQDGDDVLIVQTFRRHPTQVLSFVDGYLEGGLKMIEEGKDGETAQESFRTGVLFGELASVALDDDVFADYAASFASWSPKEQQNFRLGQREYREGRELMETDPARALDRFRSSYELASALHDTWGKAMAAGGLARAYRAVGNNEEAIAWAGRGGDLYKSLRLASSRAALLLLTGELRNEQEPLSGLGAISSAWSLVRMQPRDDPDRQKILEVYRAMLEQAGRTAEAEALAADGALSE